MTVVAFPGAVREAGLGRYRWYALGVLTLAQLCHAMDRSIIALALEPVGREFRLTDGQLGLLAGLAYGLAFAVAAIPLGIAADRYRRTRLIAVAVAVWSGFTAVCGLATSYAMLVVSRSAVGAAEAGATPTGLSLLADYFAPAQRATAVSIFYMSAGLGATAAFLGGGYIVQHYGWREAFFAAGAPGLVISLLILFTLKEPARTGRAATAQPTRFDRASIKLIFAQPGLPHCMLAITLIAVAMSGLSSWLVSFFVRIHHLEIAQAGTAVAFSFGLLGALGGVSSGFIVDRIGRRGDRYDPRIPAFSAALTCTITAALTGAALLAGSATAAVVLLLCAGLLSTAYNGPANSLFVTLAPAPARGLAVSILQFFCNLVGMGVGPLIVGRISQAAGPVDGVRWGLLAMLGFMVWGVAHFLLVARRFRNGLPEGR